MLLWNIEISIKNCKDPGVWVRHRSDVIKTMRRCDKRRFNLGFLLLKRVEVGFTEIAVLAITLF